MMISKNYIIISIIALLILIISFLGYTYYADAQAIQEIHAEVIGIDDINFHLLENYFTLTYSLNITNPTSRSIQGLSSSFNITIESNYIGTGTFSDINLDPRSTTQKTFTVTIYKTELAKATIDVLDNWFQGKNTKLIIEGTMYASILFGLSEASHEFVATT